MHSLLSSPRTVVRALCFLMLTGPLLVAPAAAEEGDPATDPVVRIFRVGALTAGRPGYLGERSPPVGPDDVSDEDNPLFGSIGEEPEYPVGAVDELIVQLRSLAIPTAWTNKNDGAFMIALGDHAILAKHYPRVLDQVARVLADLERRALTTVTVELRAVPTPTGATFDAEAMATALSDAERRGRSVTLTGFLGQRISGFTGSESAYLIDYDVEVNENVAASDPIVQVANLGLRADVRVVPTSGLNLLVDVRAWLADLAETREILTGDKRWIDARVFDVAPARGLIEARSGTWTAISGRGGEGGWAFFVRATVHGWEATPARPPSLRIPGVSMEPPAQRLVDVRDLVYPVRSHSNRTTFLMPSNFTPPEPPELRDPASCLESDDLVLLLQHASSSAWPKSDLGESTPGTLFLRSTPNVLKGASDVIAATRKQLLVSITTRADVVQVPASLFDHPRGATAGVALTLEQHGALEQALKDGTARRLDRLELVTRPGTRNAIAAGGHMTYLQDYEVEIAKGAAIGNPVVQTFFAGVQLDVTSHPTADGKGIALDVQFARTRQPDPIRRLETPWGHLEFPTLDVFRLRTGLVVPVGQTVLLGAQGNGATRHVVLLTSTIN